MRLWNECNFLVLDRPGYEIPDNLPPNFIELTALAGSKIVTEEVPSPRTRTRTRSSTQTTNLGPRTRAQAFGPKPYRSRQVSSSEIRRRISKPKPQQHGAGERVRRQSSAFGESEKHEIEQAMSSGGNFEMVDGLLTPAVLAHIIRYRLYSAPVV